MTFHMGISSSQVTKSMIFQMGRSTTFGQHVGIPRITTDPQDGERRDFLQWCCAAEFGSVSARDLIRTEHRCHAAGLGLNPQCCGRSQAPGSAITQGAETLTWHYRGHSHCGFIGNPKIEPYY